MWEARSAHAECCVYCFIGMVESKTWQEDEYCESPSHPCKVCTLGKWVFHYWTPKNHGISKLGIPEPQTESNLSLGGSNDSYGKQKLRRLYRKLQLFGLHLKIALVSLLLGPTETPSVPWFFPANFQPNFPAEEARDCNVGDPKVQKMAWASRGFHPFGNNQSWHQDFFFVFFFVGWFLGFRIYGDFGWFFFWGGWFLFSIRDGRIWTGDFFCFLVFRNVRMAFACDASGVQQKMPTGLVPRPKKMWKLWCVCESWRWQSSSKIKSWIRTLSMWRQLVETHYLDFEKVELWFKSYVHYHKPLPQSLPTIGMGEKIHLFPLSKRWGLAWMSQRLMKRNPFHIHRGHGFSREIFESQGFRVISDLIRLPEYEGFVKFGRVGVFCKGGWIHSFERKVP